MSGAKPVGALIPDVMRRAAREHRPLFAIQRRWPRLVGRQLAAHTRPVSLRRGRLVVHVDRPGDSFALNYARPKLLRQLQGTGRVEEIVIRAGSLS
jgi:hypothetical protein